MSTDTVPQYRLAIDIGGTFTDLVLRDEEGVERAYKTSSTPKDPSDGFFNGLHVIAEDLTLSVGDLLRRTSVIVHGTTITTNALVTSTGARTGLLATEGFRDVLLLRQGHRENQFNSKAVPHPHLVPRYLTVTARERVDYRGVVETALSEEDVVAAAAHFRAQGVQSVAISFVFSFFNDAHEVRAEEILRAELPGVFVTRSSSVAPEVRLYERTSTTVLNAYVGPILRAYLERLEERLRAYDYRNPVLIMQSNGGVVTLGKAADLSANTLLSGPAGAPAAAAEIGESLAIPKIMTIDMGGTSFEVSLSRNGFTETTSEGHLGGYPISTPILDINTIGAGGGSIAWITAGSMLRVGPRSAGAEPGPASYGRGGFEATVTDANLLLGYLSPTNFSGGLGLSVEEARSAVERVAQELEIERDAAAAGIYTAINAEMTDSLRLATVRRGLDPREFAIVAAGGAGPVHAAELARDLGVPLVIVPPSASVLCASGMLLTDFTRYYVQTLFGRGVGSTPQELEVLFRDMELQATKEFLSEGVEESAVEFTRIADVRYPDQIQEIPVPFERGLPLDTSALETLRTQFDRLHFERYGHSQVGGTIELVNIRLLTRGVTPKPPRWVGPIGGATSSEPRSTRPAWFGGRFVDTPAYEALALNPGVHLDGPLLAELPTSTIVVPHDYSLEVGEDGSFLVFSSDTTLAAVRQRLLRTGSSD